MDLGDKHSQLCLIDLDGNIVERKKLRTSPAALERYFGGWASMRVVLEAGAHANWVYRLIERLGHKPLMADTHRLLGADHPSVAVEGRSQRRPAAGRVGAADARDAEGRGVVFAGNPV